MTKFECNRCGKIRDFKEAIIIPESLSSYLIIICEKCFVKENEGAKK